MSFDSVDRLNLINEAIINLFELQTDRPPEDPYWSVQNTSDAEGTLVHKTTGLPITHRLRWARPDPAHFVSKWGEKDEHGNPVKYDEKEHNELKAAQREYNLWNQRGLDAYNPTARTQNYSPAWNVQGDERREQQRAYLNYVRSDPERLARFGEQSSNNRIVPRKY